MTSMSRNNAAGCDATCGFCARVYFSHPSSATTTTTTATTAAAAEGGHVHRTHLHTRCCRSVRELLATLQHVDLAQHLRGGGGGRASTRAAAAAAVDKNNSNSSADNDEAASQSFFWIDMHGCPCVEDVSLARVWSLLGLHARTQRRLAHSTHNDTTTAAAAAGGGDDDVVDGTQPRDTATMASGDSGCTHVSNNTTTTTTMSSAPPVRSMFDEHVYYEIDMDEPDTVQLLPLAGLSPADNADDNSNSTTTTTAYYVAMQLAALMEQYVLPSRADAHDAAWMAPVSENVSFADEHIHNLTHPHDDDDNSNNNDCHRQATTTTMHVPHHHHNNNSSSKHDHCDNARAVDVSAGGEGALTTGQPQRARTTVITTAHVLCFAQGCVTWCPSSNMPVRTNDEDDDNNKHNNREATAATTAAAAAAAGSTREGERVCQHVKDWSKLQEAVLARLRRSAHDNNNDKDNSESSCGGGGSPAASFSLSSAAAAPRDITTTEFIALLMSTLCYGFLPDATAALGEVDEVDAMLPTVVPEREVEQATALHRILVQRRRLSMLRRLLYRKVRLMEELDKPVMHTLAAFMAAIVPRTRHGNGGNSSSAANLSSQSHASRRGQHDGDCSRHHGAAALVMRASSSSSSAVAHSTYDVMVQFIAKLDAARLTLGNLTLVYTSAVTSRNSRTSTGTDLYQLILQYMIITVLPLSMVASHWGMNCNVPWKDSETTTPFWGLTGMMFGLMLLMLVYPMWAYKTERYQYIM